MDKFIKRYTYDDAEQLRVLVDSLLRLNDEYLIFRLLNELGHYYHPDFALYFNKLLPQITNPSSIGMIVESLIKSKKQAVDIYIEQLMPFVVKANIERNIIITMIEKENYRLGIVPYLEQLLSTMIKRKGEGLVEISLEIIKNYRPEFNNYMEQLLPFMNADGASWAMQHMVNKENYRPEFAPYIERLLPVFSTSGNAINNTIVRMVEKENYRQEFAPYITQLIEKLKNYAGCFVIWHMANHKNYRPEFMHYIELLKPLIATDREYNKEDLAELMVSKEDYRSEFIPYIDLLLMNIKDQQKQKQFSEQLELRRLEQ
jgi:hypothetical protein